MNEIKSCHQIAYRVKEREVLGIKLKTLFDLDQTIYDLCEILGEDEKDRAIHEDYCPYFAVLWESGMALADYISRQNISGKNILEIGCGLALPSFVATRLGAKVIASDFHGDVETFLNYNQKLNEIKFEYINFNWRKESPDLGKFDFVIGSDILYESHHPELVAKALINYLLPGGKIILADPGRAYVQKFVKAMNQLGYKEKMIVVREAFVFEFTLEN